MCYKYIFFIGIGGIGMSALARWFKKQNFYVMGYDLTQTQLTNELIDENIQVIYNDDVKLIPENIKNDPKNTLVIYTPAIPVKNNIYSYFKHNNFKIKKRAEVLGDISEKYFTIAVAGTHGKTTISTIIAHILTNSGYGCNAFLGGISLNYNSNLLLSLEKTMVIEADEYDKSFLNLNPNIAVITAIDGDHLDIYGNYDNLKKTFIQFTHKIKSQGVLLVNEKIKKIFDGTRNKVIAYGLNDNTNLAKVSNIRYEDDCSIFDVRILGEEIKDVKIPLLGNYNIENVSAAIAVAKILKLDSNKIKNSLLNFKGIKRRSQTIIKNKQTIFIDDYAHHPVEISALLQSIKVHYPNKKITVIFQPHLYSRTKDFAKGFADSLSIADNIILMDIYPAREEPIVGVSSKIIAKHINKKYFIANNTDEILTLLKNIKPEILLTIGAGDIYKNINSITKLIENEYL